MQIQYADSFGSCIRQHLRSLSANIVVTRVDQQTGNDDVFELNGASEDSRCSDVGTKTFKETDVDSFALENKRN